MSREEPRGRTLVLRFFREVVRPYYGLQALIALCLGVSVALEMVDPLVLRAIVDRALGDGEPGMLALLLGVLAIALVFRVAFRLVTAWLATYSGLRILFDFRHRVFEHVETQSPDFFRGERMGDVLARLTSDVEILQRTAGQTLVHASQDLLAIFAIFGVLAWLDPFLAGVLAIAYPGLGFALARINRRLRHESMNARVSLGDLYAFLEERLAGMRLVQDHAREKAEARRHVRLSRPWIRANLALSVIGGVQVSLSDLMSTGAFLVVFLIGGGRALSGELTLGTLVAFYTLASRLYRPISGLIDVNIDLQMAGASLERVYELLDREPDVREDPAAITPATIRGEIRFEDVDLKWPDGTRALDGIRMHVPPGEIVALIGPSGGGKSTLATLLARHRDPGSGRVLLDGEDVRRWRLRALRRSVGIVPQETQLFHESLAENLRFARRDATDAELIDALEAMELSDWLSALPEGLATPVGERGMRLSGGERQRLALARVLLKNPALFVLDEATSALDARTERRVLQEFLRRTAGRTVLVIAHRLGSVLDADRAIVLDHGRIVEEGPPRTLRDGDGLFAALWQSQERADQADADAHSP